MKNTSKIFPSFSCMACSYIDSDVFVFSFVYLWFSLYLQLGVYGVYSICLSYFPENEEPRITSIKELLVNNWGHIEWTITEENKNFKKLKRRNWAALQSLPLPSYGLPPMTGSFLYPKLLLSLIKILVIRFRAHFNPEL